MLVWALISLCWVVWFYPFLFRAPHGQKREHITKAGPTRVGLLFETVAIGVAWAAGGAARIDPDPLRIAIALVLAIAGCVLSWTAVKHLGKQFRVNAGLYIDHELVRTGPYSVVRHPIYAGLLCMLLSTAVAITPWLWTAIAVALFIIGTEIRVFTEERLLESRFGQAFRDYRRRVPAYVPFVR